MKRFVIQKWFDFNLENRRISQPKCTKCTRIDICYYHRTICATTLYDNEELFSLPIPMQKKGQSMCGEHYRDTIVLVHFNDFDCIEFTMMVLHPRAVMICRFIQFCSFEDWFKWSNDSLALKSMECAQINDDNCKIYHHFFVFIFCLPQKRKFN